MMLNVGTGAVMASSERHGCAPRVKTMYLVGIAKSYLNAFDGHNL